MDKKPLKLDYRDSATMKWSALWNGAGGLIEVLFQNLSVYFIGGVYGKFMRSFGVFMDLFSFNQMISAAIWGAIIGAGLGFVLSKFYEQIQDLNKRYLKGKLDSFFKLLFYPWFFSSAVSYVMTSALGFGFLSLLIVLAGSFISSYVYAKMMDKYVGNLYGQHGA